MQDISTISVEKHIRALTEISKAITSDRFIDDILRLVVTVTAQCMESKVCALWLLDDKRNVLTLRATQSLSKEYLKERTLKIGEGIVGQVAKNNRPGMVLDVLTDADYKEKDMARREGLVSLLSVPMAVKDRVIGVLTCYTSHPHEFSETERDVLITVANAAAVAIENTALMVKTKAIQEELEARKRIERAKEILMRQRGLSGPNAYRWIQKRSMDTRKTMREIAEAIILTQDGEEGCETGWPLT